MVYCLEKSNFPQKILIILPKEPDHFHGMSRVT